MVKTLLTNGFVNGGASTAAGATEYWHLSGHLIKSTTEANRDIIFRSAGTLSNLWARIQTNATSATSTIRTRDNATNGGQTITVGIAATGTFEDTSGTDTVTAGDKLCIQTITGAGGAINFRILSAIFDATTDTVSVMALGGDINPTFASTTWYYPIQGFNANAIAVETFQKCRIRKSFTAKNMGVYISTARATATTFRSRKNGADGNLVVTCTGATTGWFEDTTNSDTLAAADDYDYSVVTGTGTDTIVIATIKCEYVSTAGDGMSFLGKSTGSAIADATTVFYPIGGTCDSTTTESVTQTKARVAFDLSNLVVMVSQNDVTSASTFDLRKGAASTTITTSITGSLTGLFQDTTHTETIADTDLINFRLAVPTVSGAHTVTLTNAGIATHITAGANLTRALATETTAISDSIARIYSANRPITETVPSTESIARMSVNSRALSTETIPSSDSIVRVKGNVRTIATETVTVSDSIARLYGATRPLPETVSSSDSATRLLNAIRTLSTETVPISDSIARVKGVTRTIVETVSSSDSLARLYAATRTISETVSSSDSVARLLGAMRALTTETTIISDSIQRVKGVARSISETVNLSDSITRVLASIRALPETVTSSDSITRLLASSRAIVETTTITGTVARLLGAIRTLAETTNISDSIATLFTPGAPGNNFVRAITETVNLSESIVRRVTNTRALPETVSVSDSITRVKGAIRSLSETVNLSDSLTRLVAGIRTLPETINLSDSIQRVFTGTRTIAESVTSSSSVITLRGVVRTLTENIAVSDSLTKAFAGVRTLAETVNISDILQSLYSSAHAILGLATGEVSTTKKIEGKGPTNLRVYHVDIDIDRVPEPERDIQPSTISESHGRARRRYIDDPDLE